MAKAKRNIGLEILEGIREIRGGVHGRVTNIPSVSAVRERTGLSQARFAQLLGVSVRTLRSGSKAGGLLRAQPALFYWLLRRIQERSLKLRRWTAGKIGLGPQAAAQLLIEKERAEPAQPRYAACRA